MLSMRWAAPLGTMRRRRLVVVFVGAYVGACSGSPTGPTPPDPSGPTSAVLVGAGDIALCGSPGAEATARLLDGVRGTVFTAGDNVYPSGSYADYRDCYDPTWGRHKDRTRPTPGNHDYESAAANPYYAYFDTAAGLPGQGYYTYAVGSWRVIALNSEIPTRTGSAQYQWLRNELTTSTPACTIAIWHRPLFTSGPNRDNLDMRDIFRLLHEFGTDIVINGHDHLYERFAPQDADGRVDLSRGIRQFTVGTGGVPLYDPQQRKTNSEVIQKSWGVLKLSLSDGRYEWDFIPVPGGGSHDTGSGVCH